MQQLQAFLCISALALYALFSWAHEAPIDTMGCHEDDADGSYHCHSGKLAGREFLSREEARETLKAIESSDKGGEKESKRPQPLAAPALKIMSWNLNRVGKDLFEYDRVANVLAGADVVSLQEVEFTPTGETALLVIANIVQKKLGTKICKGWFKSTSGERARHAFLWKDAAVGLVEKTGEIRESCTDAPEVLRLDKKKPDPNEAYMATFYLKTRKQMFVVASVHLGAASKNTARDISSIFRKMNGVAWPVIITGDFKVRSKDKAFDEARKDGFKAAMTGKSPGSRGPASLTNFWVKNLTPVQAEPINLYEWFSELKPKDVDSKIATQFPIFADLSFSKEEGESLKMEMVKRKEKKKVIEKERSRRAAAVEKPPLKPLKPLNIHDNLESEEDEIDR